MSAVREEFGDEVRAVHEASKGLGVFAKLILWARFCAVRPVAWVAFLWRKDFLNCDDVILRRKCARCFLFLRFWIVLAVTYVGFSVFAIWMFAR
jgi:hypothetical protein